MSSRLASINYVCKGSGLPFFFQHGLGSRLEQPQGLLSDLSGVELISMDCPGHGKSPLLPDTPASFSLYTELLQDLVKETGHSQGVFGGISMGAGISLKFALNYPEKVKALVLVRPAWLEKGTPDNLSILLDAANLIDQENGRAIFEERKDFQAINTPLPMAGQSILGVFAPNQRQEIAQVLIPMVKDAPLDNLEELAQIKVPCIVIGNEDDPLHPFAMAQKLSEHIPGSQLHQVPSRYIDNDLHKTTLTEIVSTFIHTL